jgi:hypothetical protein
MSTEYTTRKFRSQRQGALGTTYGSTGAAAYGPGISQGWTGPKVPSGRGTSLGGFKTAAAGHRGYAMMPFAPAPTASNVTYSGYGGGATEGGKKASGAAMAAGGTMVTTMLAGGAVASAIPVAGWIVAGGLVATAGIIVLVDTFRRKGVRAARQVAIDKGYNLTFAKEYGKMSSAKLQVVKRHADRWERKIEKERKDVRKAKEKHDKKPNSKRRKKNYKRQKRQLQEDIDRLNAAKIVIGLKTTAPNEPTIAGMASTAPIVVEERGIAGDAVEWVKSDTGMIVVGSSLALLLTVGTLSTVKRRRRRRSK